MGVDFDEAEHRAINRAEQAIRAILLELMEEKNLKIESISVDTRNWADYAVTIETK
jgi:hypothetical protein